MMKKFPRILAEKSYSQFKIEKNEKNDKTALVRFELQTFRSKIQHSATEPQNMRILLE